MDSSRKFMGFNLQHAHVMFVFMGAHVVSLQDPVPGLPRLIYGIAGMGYNSMFY